MRPKLKADEVERLKLQFSQVDRNKDKKIDLEEFKEFLKETFPHATNKDLEEMVPKKLGDGDEDRFDFDQYLEFMSQDLSMRFDVKFIRHQARTWDDKLGFVKYIPFLALFIFFLVTGKGLGSSYWMQKAVMEHLEGDEFRNTDDLRYFKAYQDIGELEEFWDWNDWPMINTMWPPIEPGESAEPGSAPIDLVNFPIGALKIRQIRVAPEPCNEATINILNAEANVISLSDREARKRDYRIFCYPEITSGSTDKQNYPVQTYRVVNSFGVTVDDVIRLDKSHVADPWERDVLFEAYRYREASELNGTAANIFLGKATAYLADGYAMVVPFSAGRDEVEKIFSTLQNGITVGGWTDPETGKAAPPRQIPWIDHATRGISVEFITYNQNLDLVARFQQFVEVTAAGLLVPLHYTTTFPFFNLSRHGAGYFFLVVIFLLMILAECYSWIRHVSTSRRRYVMDSGKSGIAAHLTGIFAALTSDFWVLFDFVNLSLFLVAWAIRFYWMSLSFTSTSVLTLDWYPKDWETVGELVVILSHIDAVNALLTFLKVFYFLRLNSQLNLLTKTIGMAKAELMGIVFIFLIVFIGFALMAFVAFGTILQGYRDFSTTVSSLLRMLLGDFDYHELKEQRRVFAPILFTVFNILANFLLLNMVIAVLNQAFAEVQKGKYQPGKVLVLFEALNEDVMPDDPFVEKMIKRQKGIQAWIRGTAMWRELVYGCNLANLYTKSKSELPGGEDEWNAKLREAGEYNPRTYWRMQEDMMFYQKRSLSFEDKLKVNPMPLKFHLLDEFGADLKEVIDLNQTKHSLDNVDLAKHDLVVSPSYCTGVDPKDALLELMDFFHTWKASNASNYAFIENDDEGEGSVQYEDEESAGIAIRGSERVEEIIDNQTREWRDEWQDNKKKQEDEEDNSGYERIRRQAEKEEFERVFERIQLDEQTQHIENLQHHLDDMHSAVTGKVQGGSLRVDAKDVLIPTNITIENCESKEGPNANGVYTKKGLHNGKPYWKKLAVGDEIDHNLCIMWGDGKWWVGKPRRYAYDRVCVPSLLSWEDTETLLPPMGTGGDDAVMESTWETVMDGGIGDPPVLDYDVNAEANANTETVMEIRVKNSTTHQVNGVYTHSGSENGKPFWRKRYQPIVRYFKVEPFPTEPERTSKMRAKLRAIRDDLAAEFNVTLRVPGEPAAPDRRMQLEGDWHMCNLAREEVMVAAREVANALDIEAEDDELLPEVFIADGQEVNEATRLKKVEAIKPPCTDPQEWEQTGTGYDLDLMWKEGKWVINRRLAESSKGYIGFHEKHPSVSLLMTVQTLPGKSFAESKEHWETVVGSIPKLMARYAREKPDLLQSGKSLNEDGAETIGQEDEVHLTVRSRKPPKEEADPTKAPQEEFFEEGVSYYRERTRTNAGRDAMLMGMVFEDRFPTLGTTAEVLIPSGRLKGTWLQCTVMDEPDTSAHSKYRVSVDMESSLQSSNLVIHKEYLMDYLQKSGKKNVTRSLNVPKESIRKRSGQDAESWVSRFVSWVNNPNHEIHKEFPGLLSTRKVLNPSPQSLYFYEDPDTRYHPPLFGTTWLSTHGEESNVNLTGTTRVFLKKDGLGGLNTDPMYLAVHHAYMIGEWELEEGRSEIYHGTNTDELQATGDMLSAPYTIWGVVVGDWVQKYNAQEGLPLGQWVKREDWTLKQQKTSEQWARDFRDENSLYVCVHKWKNEAAIWELERAPERGTKMYLRKAAVDHYEEETEGLKQCMIATNYPLSYKGDGKKRYLSAFESDKRHTDNQRKGRKSYFQGMEEQDPRSYRVCAHEKKDEPEDGQMGEDASLWEVSLLPCKDLVDSRIGNVTFWWQKDAFIIDWLRNDMYDEDKVLKGVPENPIGTKWASSEEAPTRASEWELASYDELERRVEWYLDNWRVARNGLADLDKIPSDDAVLQKQHKHRLRQLKMIDQERERQNHKVLIKKLYDNQAPTYLSVWRNYPPGKYNGVWQTEGFFTRGPEEHRVSYVGSVLRGLLGPDPTETTMTEACWSASFAPNPGESVPGKVNYKNQVLECKVTAKSYTALTITVDKWREMNLEYSFDLKRTDEMMRDANSHFVLTTQQYQLVTHSTWEIEPIHDLDDTIDYAVKEAVTAAQKGLQQQFRTLIHEEMTFLLKTVMPNVLLDELGPNQLVQTLNYKIRSESIAKEETVLKGDYDPAGSGKDTPLNAEQTLVRQATNKRVNEWRATAVEEPQPDEQKKTEVLDTEVSGTGPTVASTEPYDGA
eukprot:TRINITY_DN4972_c0_g2_i1.p1 TRINITY_DN4972_c0_g2~~TRINITY_DN4972_c0_g2_i1.p1  ORF type:complete len:2244 (+),score=590.18 TRINITY_DN4972_c0_g2_i1:67-6798(+)